MKKISLCLVSMLLSSVLFMSCGGKKADPVENADNSLGKMEVVIPDELKDNKELVTYIEDMSEVADAYALLIDEAMVELGDFAGEDWEELSMKEQLKVTSKSAQIAMKAAPTMAKFTELQTKYTLFESEMELDEQELTALATVMERFEQRMEQIMEKHSSVFEGDDE